MCSACDVLDVEDNAEIAIVVDNYYSTIIVYIGRELFWGI